MPLIMRSNSESILTSDNRIKSCNDKTLLYQLLSRNQSIYIKLLMTEDLKRIIRIIAPADISYIRTAQYLELSVQRNREHHKFLLINTAPMIKGRSVTPKTYYTMFDRDEFNTFTEQHRILITKLLCEAKRVRIEEVRSNPRITNTFNPLCENTIGLNFYDNNNAALSDDFRLSQNDVEQIRAQTIFTTLTTAENISEAPTELAQTGAIDWSEEVINGAILQPELHTPTPNSYMARQLTLEDIETARRAVDRIIEQASESNVVQELLRRTQQAYAPEESILSSIPAYGDRRERLDRRPRPSEPENNMFSYLESGQI